jgi:hypothetical protein
MIALVPTFWAACLTETKDTATRTPDIIPIAMFGMLMAFEEDVIEEFLEPV